MEIATSRTGRVVLTGFFWLLVLFLYLPIAVLALFSFNDGDPSFPLSGFTTHWYGDVLSNHVLVTALARSAVVLSTVWDTPNDAAEFADAMNAWILQGDASAIVLDPNGTRVTALFASDDATLETLRAAAS